MSNDKVNDHCNPSKNTTGFWESPRGTIIPIEVLVLLAVVFYLFLATFGSHRRRCRNWFIQKGVLGAYTLSPLLVTYALGSMQSSAVKNSMYPFWAVSLLILDGCTDSITAYTLDDNRQEMRLCYHVFLCTAYVSFLTQIDDALPGSLLISITMINTLYRLKACTMASRSWNLNKMVADYMHCEHTKGEFVPATMKGCHYLIDWPLRKSKMDAPSYEIQITAEHNEVIDVDKVWRCNDRSLGPELKDTCLSFSLFHLLRRRFFGFACCESKERAHDFVFKGLLSENEDGTTDYNRVFKVIEVELAFMYDFFFTKYAVLYYGSRGATFWFFIRLAACMYLAACVGKVSTQGKSAVRSTTTTDVVIALLILASTALLEFLQLLLYWTTIWGRVSFVCQYLRRGNCCMLRSKELLTKIGANCASNKHCWQHKLGQYSLIGSLGYHNPNPSKWTKSMAAAYERFIGVEGTLLIRPTKDHAWRAKRESRKAIELSAEVKKALVDTLKRTDGKLTNGKSSLVFNRAECLLWACAQDVHSDRSCIILTWHIATCYCEMATLSPNEGLELKLHLDVATNLSKYCAYLVVYAPRLLPGHHYDTERVFDAVVGEAYIFLASSRDKYEAMRNLAESEDTIFQRGVKLGKQLDEIQDATQRWKVMADFWAEMMLYVAPSDNVKEHIEHLAQGGEFITHLWALLSHASILERDQQNPSHPHAEDTQNSANHQETEENSASHEGATSPDHMDQMSNNLQLVPLLDSGSVIPLLRHRAVLDPLPSRWMNRATEFLFLTRSWNVFNSAARRAMLVPGSPMGGFALQAPTPPGVQARLQPLHALKITTANEWRIEVPEASSFTQQALHEQV